MKTDRRWKISSYALLNLLIAVSFQNCKSQSDTIALGPIAEAAAETSNHTQSINNNENATRDGDSDDYVHSDGKNNNNGSGDLGDSGDSADSETLRRPIGETDDIVFLEPPQSSDSKFPFRFSMMAINKHQRLAEIKIHKKSQSNELTQSTLTCQHLSASVDLSFDCSHIDDFILEDLEQGRHLLRMILRYDDGSIQESPPFVFILK